MEPYIAVDSIHFSVDMSPVVDPLSGVHAYDRLEMITNIAQHVITWSRPRPSLQLCFIMSSFVRKCKC